MSLWIYAIPLLAVLHLWAIRQYYYFPEALGPPPPVREQPWAKAWFPAVANYFNLWFIYTILNDLFVVPHGGWQLPPLLNHIGEFLWVSAIVALTGAYTFHHFRSCLRTCGFPKVTLYHAIHGVSGLFVLGFVGYVIARGLMASAP